MQHGTTSPGVAISAAAADASLVRGFIDAIPDALTIHDEHCNVLEANAAACALYGLTRDELVTRNLFDLSPTLPPGCAAQAFDACVRGETFTIETSALRRDGRETPVEVHARLHRLDGIPRMLWLARGIGHWRYTANRLHEAEQRDHVLLQSIDSGVVVRDGDGRITYMNPAAYRIFRLDEDALAQIERDGFPGWRFSNSRGEVLQPADFPSIRALQYGIAVDAEILCFWLPHVATPVWMKVSATPLFRAGAKRAYQVVTTLSDVTEIKRTQTLLEQTQILGNMGGFELILDTRELLWTHGMYRLFDLTPNFPLALDRVLPLFRPESRERVERDLASTIEGVQVGKQEYEIVTMLGRNRWISAISHATWRGNEIASISGTCQDITERKRMEHDLRRKAVTDPVTGLPNRESILEELDRQIAAADGAPGPALLYVDLDRFKTINNLLGADAGDHLLASAAIRLRSCLPANAHCGRFASDEFLVVLPPPAGAATAADVAQAVNEAFGQPFEHASEDFLITASVGIARCPDDGDTGQQLLKHADAAMDVAKQCGRGSWQAFSPAIAHRLQNTLATESQLRHALERGELRLAYQPQVELDGGRVCGAEALLRWNHPQRGCLLPLDFIQHAESSGDIVPIGAWAIDEACRQLREWRTSGLAIERVGVNVSQRQLLSESFLDRVNAALERHDLAGDSLELEMVERTLVGDTPDAMKTLADLRALGVLITIDDFGEGYSALNYLRRLPIDGFKISYDFMRRVPHDPADTAICEALLSIARALDLRVVGEGIETEAQRVFLLLHGMRVGQGHLFSEALPATEFSTFARARG